MTWKNLKFNKQICLFFSFKFVNVIKIYISFILKDKSYEYFTWKVQQVFIPLEPYCFSDKRKTKSPLLLTIIIGDVYLLHIINETVSILCPLKNLIYTYKYMKIIILIRIITLHDGLSRLLYLYYRRSYKIRHVVLVFSDVQIFQIWHVYYTRINLGLTNYQVQIL
jgi:hypothetical protein